jgi:PQQ-like domain
VLSFRICLIAVMMLAWTPAWSAPSGAPAEVLTFHTDAARTGWNATESVLTPASVRSGGFSRLWTVPVEGAIFAEPLVAADVLVRGTPRTVVYTVTERDRIYALDAADGRLLWGPVTLGTPVARANLPCGNIDPVGITSTPVIDRASSTLYVAGLTTPDDGRTKVYKLAALDLASGAMRPGYPVVIAPPAASGLRFDPGVQQQRGALTLLRAVVYLPFGGYLGDCGNYHGWVVGVPTAQPGRQQAFATPTHREGGIWATGGLAADAADNLYASTGNSDSGGPVDLSNSVVRLTTTPQLAFSGRPTDFFAPSNFISLNDSDTDLGSSAPMVLPVQQGSTTPDLVFIAGKQGVGYLINRAAMGGVSHGDGVRGEGVYSRCIFGDCRSRAPQVFSASAYWDGGSAGRLILVPGRGAQPQGCRGTGGLVALRLEIDSGTRASTFGVAWCSPSMRDPGAPSVTGTGPDGGVVWVVDTAAAVLFALNARTGEELYHSDGKDALEGTHRFITPAVTGGRVYVGAGEAVAAYGIAKH